MKDLHVHMQTMRGGREQEQECRGAEVQASQPSSSTGHAPKKIRIDSFLPQMSHAWMPHLTNYKMLTRSWQSCQEQVKMLIRSWI